MRPRAPQLAAFKVMTVLITALMPVTLIASPGAAGAGMAPQSPASQSSASQPSGHERPVTDSNPRAQDIATTPLTDLNIKKGEMPVILQTALEDPYALGRKPSCATITREVLALNDVLGEDVDIERATNKPIRPGVLAQSVVGGFIPFRGVLREITGANAQQRRMQQAIYAGIARRAFLKGVGMQRGCRYPARPA